MNGTVMQMVRVHLRPFYLQEAYSLQLLLPDCIYFSCCSLIASASVAASQLYPLQLLLFPIVNAGQLPVQKYGELSPRVYYCYHEVRNFPLLSSCELSLQVEYEYKGHTPLV